MIFNFEIKIDDKIVDIKNMSSNEITALLKDEPVKTDSDLIKIFLNFDGKFCPSSWDESLLFDLRHPNSLLSEWLKIVLKYNEFYIFDKADWYLFEEFFEEDLKDLETYYQLIKKNHKNEIKAFYGSNCYYFNEKAFNESFCGHHLDEMDYAEEHLHSFYDIPEGLIKFINMEKYKDSLFIDGDYEFVNSYVFCINY